MPYTALKMALFAPIPRASVMMATIANPGRLIKSRRDRGMHHDTAGRRRAFPECGKPYRGVASGSPPSTGIVEPVVGVRRVAKNRTAFATCSAVTFALSRLRPR